MSFLDMKWYEICAEKSTENPMHIMRLIIEIESRLTSHNVMNPTTPTSIETIENVTQSKQILLVQNIIPPVKVAVPTLMNII